MRNVIYSRVTAGLFLLAAAWNFPVQADVMFKGNLLDRPCSVDPVSSSLDVTFLDTATPVYRNLPGKSYEKRFTINLVNCHALTIGKVVKLVFTGQEEPKLPGYLAVSGVNAGRLGIGLIDTDGSTQLKLGNVHNLGAGDSVNEDTVAMNFKAYVQATPEAITQKSVEPGNYSATTTFELNYQ